MGDEVRVGQRREEQGEQGEEGEEGFHGLVIG